LARFYSRDFARWLSGWLACLVLALDDHDPEPLLPLVDPQLPPRAEALELLALKDLHREKWVEKLLKRSITGFFKIYIYIYIYIYTYIYIYIYR
jgi:hypothetical protein